MRAAAVNDPPADHRMPIEPIVKWAGGKTSLLPELLKRLPARFGAYHEPFAGGAALFFHLARPFSVLSDANIDLIHAYRWIARNPEGVIKRLEGLEEEHRLRGAELYYEMREQWNGTPAWTDVTRAAAFVYLNRAGYNGLWRVNRKGAFNVPVGRSGRHVRICFPAQIRAAARLLRETTLSSQPFEVACARAVEGDLVYLDPPYMPVSATARFTSYTPGGFGLADHKRLAEVAAELVERGVHVMLSNAETAAVRRTYKHPRFRVYRVRAPRPINRVGARRGKVGEVLIVGTPA